MFLTLSWFLAYIPIGVCAQEKIVAVVNSDCITQKDLDDFTSFMRMQYAPDYKGDRLEEKMNSMKKDLLDKLVEDRLILQQARKNKISVDESRIKTRTEELKKKYASEAEFKDALRNQGLVEADLEARLREQLLMYMAIEKMVKAKITVQPQEITDFYQKNTHQFRVAEERNFYSVAVNDEKTAGLAAAGVKRGEKLEAVVKRLGLSLVENNASRDGKLKKEVEDVLFGLKPEELSRPIETAGIWYLFLVKKITPPRIMSLAEAQGFVYAALYNAKMQEALNLWLDDLKKGAYIKIMQE